MVWLTLGGGSTPSRRQAGARPPCTVLSRAPRHPLSPCFPAHAPVARRTSPSGSGPPLLALAAADVAAPRAPLMDATPEADAGGGAAPTPPPPLSRRGGPIRGHWTGRGGARAPLRVTPRCGAEPRCRASTRMPRQRGTAALGGRRPPLFPRLRPPVAAAAGAGTPPPPRGGGRATRCEAAGATPRSRSACSLQMQMGTRRRRSSSSGGGGGGGGGPLGRRLRGQGW